MLYLFQKCPRVNHLKCQSDEDDGRMQAMALPVVEFSRQGYKIGKVFA
jgi:hypothetical protein